MSIEIRAVAVGDEALFEQIAPEVFDNPVTAQTLAGFLTAPGHHLVVALCDGQMVGQASGMVHRHPDGRAVELYVDEVGVSPAYQRRGIATQMIAALFELGRRAGCTEAWLGTEPDNVAAHGLYAPLADPVEAVSMFVFKLTEDGAD